jgi:hypothetical protein
VAGSRVTVADTAGFFSDQSRKTLVMDADCLNTVVRPGSGALMFVTGSATDVKAFRHVMDSVIGRAATAEISKNRDGPLGIARRPIPGFPGGIAARA